MSEVDCPICPICLEILHVLYSRVRLLCGHWFCTECINTWWNKSKIKDCPYCMKSNDPNVSDNKIKAAYHYDGLIIKATSCNYVKNFKELFEWIIKRPERCVEYIDNDNLKKFLNQRIESLVERNYLRINNNSIKYIT